jgi:hypothetical protein
MIQSAQIVAQGFPLASTALIVIAVFQALQSAMMMMGTFIMKDLRDRVARLENIEMGKNLKS